MKRFISAALAVIMLMLFYGCGETQTPATSSGDAPTHIRSEGAWGIGEFMQSVNAGNSPISGGLGEDGLAQYIQHPQLDVQMEQVTYYLEEALFDGRQLHAVFTVIPNDVSKTLLMTAYGYSPEDTIFYSPEESAESEQTFGDKATAEGKDLLSVSVICRDNDAVDGAYTEQYHTDGSVTVYFCQNFLDISDVQRSFALEFSERKVGTDQEANVERELVLTPCGEWEEVSTCGAERLFGSTVSAKFVRNQFEAYMTIRFDLLADISSAELDEWYLISVEQYDAETGNRIPELGSGMMMFDQNGDPVDKLSGGDSVVFFAYMQSDTVLPRTIDVKLIRVFGDGSEAGNTQLSFS